MKRAIDYVARDLPISILVVKDNLKLLEEQLKGLSSKEEAKFGAFPSSDMGVSYFV